MKTSEHGTSVLHLLVVEMRRALHRRVTRVLVLMALTGVCLLGVIAFFDSSGKTVAELHRDGGTHPAVMADWWVAGGGDGILMIAAIPLLVGAVLGGAIFAGAEWRAGTVTTVLTWEPRRLRLHGARTACAFLLALAIAFVLQVLFLAATLPAVLLHGTTAGVDGQWWLSLVGAVGRSSVVAAGAAVLGVSLATLGRNSTFALGAVFAWMAFGENLVRSIKPSVQHLLVGENLAVALTGGGEVGGSRRRPLGAGRRRHIARLPGLGGDGRGVVVRPPGHQRGRLRPDDRPLPTIAAAGRVTRPSARPWAAPATST